MILKKYTFMSNDKYGNCTKEEAVQMVKETTKPILYTYGLIYRNPTTHNQPITKEQAMEYVKDSVVDIAEHECYVHINRYSTNDLF